MRVIRLFLCAVCCSDGRCEKELDAAKRQASAVGYLVDWFVSQFVSWSRLAAAAAAVAALEAERSKHAGPIKLRAGALASV